MVLNEMRIVCECSMKANGATLPDGAVDCDWIIKEAKQLWSLLNDE